MQVVDELYPELKNKICHFCKQPITLERKGGGTKRMGLRNYWYETDHRCDRRNRYVIASMPPAARAPRN